MSWILTTLSGLLLGKQTIQEKRQPYIPAENWRNSDLIYQDKVVKMIGSKQFMNNLANGKYYLPDVPPNAIIDDMERYKQDRSRDFCKAYKAAKKGEYKNILPPNVTEEERRAIINKLKLQYGLTLKNSDMFLYWTLYHDGKYNIAYQLKLVQ